MTPTHQIESRSAGQAPEEQFRVRKRNRTALSCGPCRHRKMRCDRALPCNNCIHRDEIDGCTYTFSSVHKKNTLYTMKNTANGSPSEVQSRINHLESLVLSLMSRDKSSTDMSGRNSVLAGADQPQRANIWLPPVTTQDDARREKEEDSELDGLTSSIGSMTILQDLPVFIPATHWYTIISEIKEVKRWFEEHSMQLEDIGTQLNASSPDNEPVGVSHVSVQESPPRIAEMSSKLPAKPTCDVIMARFFETGTVDPAYNIIHRSTFQKQYDAHWHNPSQTPPMWSGMVYAMIVLALQSYEGTGEELPEFRGQIGQLIHDYGHLAAQIIKSVDVSQPRPYMIEAGLLYALGELKRSGKVQLDVLYDVSLTVRLAMILGYHCEPRLFSEFSPFTGEMRRRIWCAVRQLDLLFSSSLGLQPIIRPESTNTELPSNLYDDELNENMKSLPPSRPMTDPTPMCYVIYKSKLLSVFGQVWEGTQLASENTVSKAIELDKTLQDVHNDIPSYLRMRPIEESLRDPPEVVMQRYALDILFLRTQCTLHRRFMSFSENNSKNGHSRRMVIDSSLMILQHQAILHKESGLAGRLRTIKWLNNALAGDDFLFGAMNVCLRLYAIIRAEHMGKYENNDVSEIAWEERSRMMAALEQSQKIWESFRTQNVDASKAYGMLTAMLHFFQNSGAEKKHRDHHKQQEALTLQMGEVPDHCIEIPSSAAEIPTSFDASQTRTLPQHLPRSSNVTSMPPTNTFITSQPFLPSASSTGFETRNGITNTPNLLNTFSASLSFPNIDIPETEIDWDAWASYANYGFPSGDGMLPVNKEDEFSISDNNTF